MELVGDAVIYREVLGERSAFALPFWWPSWPGGLVGEFFHPILLPGGAGAAGGGGVGGALSHHLTFCVFPLRVFRECSWNVRETGLGNVYVSIYVLWNVDCSRFRSRGRWRGGGRSVS